MRSLLRFALWAAGSMLLLLVGAFIAAMIYVRTPSFRAWVLNGIVSYFNRTYGGELAAKELYLTPLGHVEIRGLALHFHGREVITASAVSVDYLLVPLLWHRIDLSQVTLLDPSFDLSQEAGGNWNLLQAMAERKPSPTSSGAAYSVVVGDLSVQNGAFRVTPSGGPQYRLSNMDVGASAEIQPQGAKAQLTQFAAILNAPGYPQTRLQASAVYDGLAKPATITVAEFEAQTAKSLARLNGAVSDLKAQHFSFTLTVPHVAAADLNPELSGIQLHQDLSGWVQLSGAPSDLKMQSQIDAGQGSIKADCQGAVSGKLQYRGKLELANLNLPALLGLSEMTGDVGGRFSFAGGQSIASLAIDGDLNLTGLSYQRMRIGTATFNTRLQQQKASLSGRVSDGVQVVNVSGSAVVPAPLSYDIAIRTEHLDPSRFVASVPRSDLNLAVMLAGTGFTPGTMNATTNLQWAPSRIGAVAITNGRIAARIARGWADLEQADINGPDSTISLKGNFAVDSRPRGKIRYDVRTANLSPWLQLAKRSGGGALAFQGNASGDFRNFTAQGLAQLANAHIDNYSARKAELRYDLTGHAPGPWPQGRISAALFDTDTGLKLNFLKMQVLLSGNRELLAKLSVTAQDKTRNALLLDANGSYQPGRIAAQLQKLDLDVPTGVWSLIAPAEIAVRGKELSLSQFELQNRDQLLKASGSVSQSGTQNFSLELQGLKLADLMKVGEKGTQKKQAVISGVLSLQARLGGTAASPIISALAKTDRLVVDRQTYRNFQAKADYRDAKAVVAASIEQDSAHQLSANGTVPVRISWDRGFQYQPIGDSRLRVFSQGLDIAAVAAFSPRTIKDVSGSLMIDLTLEGPINHLRSNGSIRLARAAVNVLPLNVKISDAEITVQIDPQAIRLTTLSASAGDGKITGSGSVAIQSGIFTPGQVSLDVSINNWPAIETAMYQATVGGNLNLRGPFDAPSLDGRIDVMHGSVEPPISFMQAHKVTPDATIVVVRGGNLPEPAKPSASEVPPLPSFESAAVRLEVAIHHNTWIKVGDSAVEIAGAMKVSKRSGGPISLSGTIHSVRGTLAVANQQFNLTTAEITFTGGSKIDPILNIEAQRQVPQYLISAIITGSAEKPVLTLQSQPDLPQSEILSLLMFGKPVASLSGTQQQSLQQQALTTAGTYAGTALAQSVSQALGLQQYGLSVTQGGGVGINKYVGQNVYVSAGQQNVGTQHGGQASITYSLTRQIDVQTSTSTLNGNQIELQWHKDY